MSDHKFKSKVGHAMFWSHIVDAVSYRDDHLDRHVENTTNHVPDIRYGVDVPVKRAVCSHCESHIGFIYPNGPPPFYKKF